MIDARKVEFGTMFNAYKNDGVKSGSTTISGTLNTGVIGYYDTDIILPAKPDYFTIMVKANDFVYGGAQRWKTMPSTVYCNVPCSGPGPNWDVLLGFVINDVTLTLRAWTLNNSGVTITWTSTTIDFQYVAYSLAN